MSMCDTCLKPGHCCQSIFLNGGTNPNYFGDPMSFEKAEHMAMRAGLPFRPERQEDDGSWRWWCTVLDRSTGRCTDYENRPQLCRSYLPGEDGLCFHYFENVTDGV